MSKVTRSTVSVRRSWYQRLFAYAQTQGRSCADLIEEMIAKLTGIEPEAARPARRRRVAEGEPLEITSPAEIADGHAPRVRAPNWATLRRRRPAPPKPTIPEGC